MPAKIASKCRRLEGKVCVIAGAASVIGRAVADRLISEGAVVVGIDQEEHTTGSLSMIANLSNETEVQNVFARIFETNGRIDFLYNNAGAVSSEDKSVVNTTTETLDRIFAANFRTAWLCCKYCVPFMLSNEPPSGSIVNSSSFLANMGSATGQMAYNAAKAAVSQLSRDLGTNLARLGIRVNALSRSHPNAATRGSVCTNRRPGARSAICSYAVGTFRHTGRACWHGGLSGKRRFRIHYSFSIPN